MQRTGKSFHHRGMLALPPAQQLQVTAGRSLTSESMRHVATIANDGLQMAGTVAYRRALPAWHHEDRPLLNLTMLMIRATTRQARRISAAPTLLQAAQLEVDFSSIPIRR